MSARPQRERKAPVRLSNNQGRNATQAALAAKALAERRNTVAKVATGPSTVIKKRKPPSNIGVNPKSKLLNTLARIRNQEAPNMGLNRTGYIFLASLYRNHPATQLKKYAFEWSNNRQREFMKKQHQTLVKNTSRLNVPNETVNIPMNDEKMHDLLVMLWMDMSHDGLFNGTFNNFLNSPIKKEITQISIPPKRTALVEKFLEYDILKLDKGKILLGSNIEQKQKKYMHEIWGDPSYRPKIVKKTASILSIVKNKSKPIYVSYDAENSDYITEILAKSRMDDGTYYLKRIFTIANLMDPGRGAAANVGGFGRSGGSVNKLINRLFDEKNSSTPFKFNYQMFKFEFGKYFTVELVPDGSKFNAKLNGKMMNMQVKRSAAIIGNALTKISKTFGDFLQILTVAHLRKSGKNIVSSSQDGGFVGMTGFVQGTLFGIEPALISDSTTVIGTGNNTETGIKFYGLKNFLAYNVQPERSRVTTQNNNNNNNNNNNVSQPSPNRMRTSVIKPSSKRPRNNNNVNQPMVSASRSNLIENLKKKNLPNFVINGLVKRYDNKQQTVNQILRQANNFGKTFTMGKTAQRIGTLRRRL